eukprot:scpid20204/ scgid4951/ 
MGRQQQERWHEYLGGKNRCTAATDIPSSAIVAHSSEIAGVGQVQRRFRCAVSCNSQARHPYLQHRHHIQYRHMIGARMIQVCHVLVTAGPGIHKAAASPSHRVGAPPGSVQEACPPCSVMTTTPHRSKLCTVHAAVVWDMHIMCSCSSVALTQLLAE